MSEKNQFAAWARQLTARIKQLEGTIATMAQEINETPPSITEELDRVPGRRIFYTLAATQAFTIAQDGVRGNPMQFNVFQDGPFVMTHWPMAIWRPNLPAAATNFGQWSPVTSWPVPLQQQTNQDQINLSWELEDGGTGGRKFQNIAAPPTFSRPNNLMPLPVPTLWSPNSVINFYPTYEDIFFDPGAATPSTGGVLVVGLIGYKAVNL